MATLLTTKCTNLHKRQVRNNPPPLLIFIFFLVTPHPPPMSYVLLWRHHQAASGERPQQREGRERKGTWRETERRRRSCLGEIRTQIPEVVLASLVATLKSRRIPSHRPLSFASLGLSREEAFFRQRREGGTSRETYTSKVLGESVGICHLDMIGWWNPRGLTFRRPGTREDQM